MKRYFFLFLAPLLLFGGNIEDRYVRAVKNIVNPDTKDYLEVDELTNIIMSKGGTPERVDDIFLLTGNKLDRKNKTYLFFFNFFNTKNNKDAKKMLEYLNTPDKRKKDKIYMYFYDKFIDYITKNRYYIKAISNDGYIFYVFVKYKDKTVLKYKISEFDVSYGRIKKYLKK